LAEREKTSVYVHVDEIAQFHLTFDIGNCFPAAVTDVDMDWAMIDGQNIGCGKII
jgi:hypothetical protein